MADNNEEATNDDAAEDNAPGVQLENIDLDAAAAEVENTDVVSEMETSFLAYSLSVIMSRAIPDVRDGLKPVQRRVIYAMYESGLRPDKGYKKSVATVGEVMKKYHPHGDSSIYDTLVRLAQSWSMNVPLVDGHGNFGSPDDGPAAMRYCAPGHVRVRVADGTTRRLDQFVADAEPNSDNDIDVKVVGKDGNPVRATQLFHSGDHETLRVTTRAGFQLEGTHNHPVLTLQNVAGVPLLQWKLMEELEPGDHVAMLRTEQPTMVHPTDNDLDLALLAGAFVSEGWNGDRSGFNNTDKVFFDSVLRAYHRAVGDAVYTGDTQLPSGKRLYSLDIHNQSELDATPLAELSGLKSANKRVPEFIWQSGTAVKQRFLQALFEGDGSCSQLGDSSIQVSYSTRSKQLASDVQQLLLEFGVLSRQVIYDKGEYKVVISNRHDAQRFAAQVGFLATKQTKLTGLLEALPAKTRGLTNDHVPFLREYVLDSSTCNRWVHKHNIDTYERWERDRELILEGIYDDETRQVATELLDAGYYYAEVAAIEDAGVQPVYSLKIDTDDHAFITDGFVSHNTEARMNSAAVEMVGEVFEDTVDFAPNFDGSEEEPTVLPSGIPNLLVNGVTGIAVGIATSIPPHNLQEVTEALTWMLEDADRIDNATDEDIMQFIPAPDFPTGGQLVGLEDMAETYAKGGSVRIRATTNIEDVTARKRGIVVTELPYTVGPEKVITDIQKRVREKDIEGISDIKDLSDRKVGTKLVIECKAGYDPEAVRDRLFALTSLEKNYTVNMVALADGEPAELTLVDMCRHYVKHRLEVLVRRTTYRLGKAEDRAHIVGGLLKALDQIDLVVQTIRSSKNTKSAAKKLKKKLDLTDVQVSYILDMPLKRLTQLEGTKLEDELEDLNETIAGLKELLEDDGLQRQTVTDELQTVAGRYGRPRATAITDKDAVKRRHVKDATARIPDDPCVITLNIDGELGRMPTGGRKSRKKARRADILQSTCRTTNHSEFILLTDQGRGYVIDAIDLPEVERGGGNVHVGVVAPVGAAETPIAVVNPTETDVIAMATRNGILKRVKTDGLPVRAKDYDVISLDEDDEVVGAAQARDEDHLIVVSSDGQLLRTEASNVRPQGRTAGGVKGINLSKGAHAVTFGVWRHDHDEDTDGHQLVVLGTDNEGVKTSRLDIFPDKNRSTKGVRCIRLDVKGDQTVEVAWVGAGEPISLSASNRPKQVPDKLSKRASSANRLGNQALDLGFTRPKAYKEA